MSLREHAAAAEKAGTVNRVTTERWKWVPDKELLGIFTGRESVKSTKKDMPDFYTYDFETDDGPVNVLFSTAFDKDAGARLVERELYSVLYKGKIDLPKNRTMHVYVVKGYGKVTADNETDKVPF